MRIAYIVPGSGNSFYCQNCLRDAALIRHLREKGDDVVAVPMYLPALAEAEDVMGQNPVFFGAVSLYLKQRLGFPVRLPFFLQKALDSLPALRMAAKRAGAVRAKGLGAMTLSMLEGKDPVIISEARKMVDWLLAQGSVDVVHFSNALILGLAPYLKHKMGASVVCSLQDEHHWLDELGSEYSRKCYDALVERAASVDAFIAVSGFFAGHMQARLKTGDDKMHVVYPGISVLDYEISKLPLDRPVIGYLSRISEAMGFSELIKAFDIVRKTTSGKNAKLRITGGMTSDDRKFLTALLSKYSCESMDSDIEIIEDFSRESRIGFLKSLTMLCVPEGRPEAMGVQVIEALASGVPVVHPDTGGAPELINASGAGKVMSSSDPRSLADCIVSMLNDPESLIQSGKNARSFAESSLDVSESAQQIMKVYHKVL